MSELNSVLIGMFVPSNILEDFEVWDAYAKQGIWVIELREKEERIPSDLSAISKAKNIVLDGFCYLIDMLSFGFSLGPVYLRIYRRRLKQRNENTHYSNSYDLQLKGYKMVPKLGVFLKEEDIRARENIKREPRLFTRGFNSQTRQGL